MELTKLVILVSAVTLSTCQYFPNRFHHFDEPFFGPPINERIDPEPFVRGRSFHNQYAPLEYPGYRPFFLPYFYAVPRNNQQSNQVLGRNSGNAGNDEQKSGDASVQPEVTVVNPASANGQFTGPLYVTPAKPNLPPLSAESENLTEPEKVEIVPLLTIPYVQGSFKPRSRPSWFREPYPYYPFHSDPEFFY